MTPPEASSARWEDLRLPTPTVDHLRRLADGARDWLAARAAGADTTPPGARVIALEGAPPGPAVHAAAAAATVFAGALGRRLFRLEPRGLDGPATVGPAIGALLDAAATSGAVTLLEHTDLLLPAPTAGTDAWALGVAAATVRAHLDRHPGVVLMHMGSPDRLHPLLVDHPMSSVTLV